MNTSAPSSTIPWAPRLPHSWGAERGKSLFERRRRAVRESDEIITAFRDGTVTLRANRREDGFTIAAKEIGYQGVRRGDLVIHSMDGFAGAIGVSDADGKATPVYLVCTPKREADPRFFAYALRETANNGYITSLARGIRERSTSFGWSDFGGQRLPTPPLPIQRAIADFLDRKTAAIDALIEKKERLLALLEENRAALIHRAVTKGLDPGVPMKDSRVLWIGEIPAHWKAIPLKRLLSKIGSGRTPRGGASAYVDSGIVFIRSQNVHFGELRLDDVVRIPPREDEAMKGTRIKAGDVLLNITGASIGRACQVPPKLGPANVNQHVSILRPRPELDSDFLALSLEAASMQAQIALAQGGAAREGLNSEATGNLVLATPPSSEQRELARRLGQRLASLAQVARRASTQITLLHEYRQSLITHAVTGQLDIPEEAA